MMKETLVSICPLLNKHKVDGLQPTLMFGINLPSIISKIIKAFKEYGVDVSELEEAVFDPQKTFLRFPTPGFKTEFLPSVAGDMTFKEAQEKAENIELNGVNIPVIGYDHLLKNKTLTNRLKDQADVDELTKRKKGRGNGLGL